jgi:excisionase family DNA binding protein
MAREYYSIPEAAAILGISRIAVFKKVKKGQLEALRFGRNWAVPAHALQRPPAPVPARPALPSKKKEAEVLPPLRSDNELDSMGWD